MASRFEKLKAKLAKRNSEREISPLENWVRKFLILCGIYDFVLEFQVDYYFIDIAFPHIKFGVELDGKEFHQDKKRDENRDSYLESKGWEIMRIPSDQCWKPSLLAQKLLTIYSKVFPGKRIPFALQEFCNDHFASAMRIAHRREKELIYCHICDICHLENNCGTPVFENTLSGINFSLRQKM